MIDIRQFYSLRLIRHLPRSDQMCSKIACVEHMLPSVPDAASSPQAREFSKFVEDYSVHDDPTIMNRMSHTHR